jgi:hypothetical protein
MRKVVAMELVSLDGVLEGHGGVPGLREDWRHHRHVRQCHQRDVPQLDNS